MTARIREVVRASQDLTERHEVMVEHPERPGVYFPMRAVGTLMVAPHPDRPGYYREAVQPTPGEKLVLLIGTSA